MSMIIQSFLAYLKNPIPQTTRSNDRGRTFFVLLGINLALLIPISLFGVPFGENIVGMPKNNSVANFEKDFLTFAILSVTLVPLLEELAFRLFVTTYNKTKIVLAAFFLGLISLTSSIGVFIFTSLIVFGAIKFIRTRAKANQQTVSQWWNTHFGFVFYGSALFFGFFHISNWDVSLLSHLTLLALPFLTMPQIMNGVIFGYTRIHLGFIYGLMLHITSNFMLLSYAIFFAA